MKVVSLIGTRPELIKMSRVISALDDYTRHVLVHSGQNYDYELNQIFFEDLGIRRPDHFLEAAGANAVQTIARVLEKFDQVLEKESPDACLIYGDTNSCLGILAAKRRKIPIFHLEAGNRCFDQRVPEEINRKIVDHLSDINMVHSEHARQYLISEGLPAQQIIKTGSPLPEIFAHYGAKIDASQALTGLGLSEGGYFVVSLHREENVDDPSALESIMGTLRALAAKHDKKVVFSVHPRTRVALEKIAAGELGPEFIMCRPLGFFDYVKLQKCAYCVLSDSGTVTEESDLLGFPAVTLRQTCERPEGMDAGTLIMTGHRAQNILESVEVAVRLAGSRPRSTQRITDYDNLDLSGQVIKTIYSFRDYVMTNTWKQGGVT